MSNIRKIALVPAELAQQQAQQMQVTQPAVLRLSQFDEQMKQVLDSSFPSDVKFKLYNHVLRQQAEVADNMKKPVEVKIKEEVVPRPRKELPVGRLMRNMPARKEEAAMMLADHLSESDINFNDINQLVVDGHPVEGSNMFELFEYANRDLSRAQPKGWPVFRHLLNQTNVPLAAITNRNLSIQRGQGIKWESIYV